MDLHHRLRRDPNWHPSACNICGQLGHQASTCPNGTVNWTEKYGKGAFMLRINHDPKEYRDPTDGEWDAMMKDLDKKSTDYMELRKQVLESIDYEEMSQKVAEMLKEAESQMGMGSATQTNVQAPQPEPAKEDPLPPGWAAAKDPQGRTYYWFKKTQKVQWERPTPESDTGE
uniref:WW domain-containing protein n=1 Tax=Tetraselmis sp. GSL018 TaxID=582737 RepID=A0A061R9E3_9CHLO|mmetsp:Transcript_25727/g.61279  ORF Transcript_25727/g.61279 Transcript_25727/m.61279 type:complete len:172 (-) Transcript_25727:115-630(-)|eukprot:CAMPEP_0177597096 /NCGR_PEP_ID=MMETSP0419_2-20121207/11508_1 /TAXON_ID=582737 /ORGANISM="Tetraselmis sp., Strain GSL018" /LENGTH=171 /DNA_ID=CAMNT_0019089201 /DNA_START=148 /DNA_END=663 /DNA_ORIENTATION=+